MFGGICNAAARQAARLAPLSRICNSARNIGQFAIGFAEIASPSCLLKKENKQ
jgi:hypothetical protein